MKEFLLRLIRWRKATLRQKVCGKNVALVHASIKKIETFMRFYPNIKEENLVAFCSRNIDAVQAIMPGKTTAQFTKFNDELTNLIHT